MHLVTKILIVFGSILSIVLAALAMFFASNAQEIRNSVAAEKASVTSLQAQLGDERTKGQQELANAKRSSEQAASELNRLASENAALKNEKTQRDAELGAAKLDAERARAESRSKDQMVATNTALVEALNKEVTDFRKTALDQAKRETELTTRLNDLESQNQVFAQNIKALQEQLAEARLAAERAAASATQVASSTSGSALGSSVASGLQSAVQNMGIESAGPLVSARVKRVVQVDSGDQLAFIGAGSASGLKVGQRMHIVRDGKFVASLVLTVVEGSEAAGRIDKLGRSIDVLGDDLVVSRVN